MRESYIPVFYCSLLRMNFIHLRPKSMILSRIQITAIKVCPAAASTSYNTEKKNPIRHRIITITAGTTIKISISFLRLSELNLSQPFGKLRITLPHFPDTVSCMPSILKYILQEYITSSEKCNPATVRTSP